jgi:hypothetical protein
MFPAWPGQGMLGNGRMDLPRWGIDWRRLSLWEPPKSEQGSCKRAGMARAVRPGGHGRPVRIPSPGGWCCGNVIRDQRGEEKFGRPIGRDDWGLPRGDASIGVATRDPLSTERLVPIVG